MTESADPVSDAEITLAHDPISAGSARRFVRRFVADHHVVCDLDAAELLVSEVATNAVLHAVGVLTVYVAVTADALRVEVHDSSARLPRQRDHADDATTGRGLDLVSTLAAQWGAHTLHAAADQRKVVWFELPCTTAAG